MIENLNVTFYPSRLTGSVPKGITISDAARKLGIDIETPCSGTGKCGKDIVQIRTDRIFDTVLACKTPVETNLEITIPSHEKNTLKAVEHFHLKGISNKQNETAIRKVVIRNGEDCYTEVHVNGIPVLIENGNTAANLYGVALDIGTTTIVASLVDLNNGKMLGSSSILNPLVFYGHDVMSRIKYSVSQKNGLLRMHKELISAINLLIDVLSAKAEVSPTNIYHLIAAGNTTMQHIFLKKGIKSIGEYPYNAEVLDSFNTTAKELKIKIAGFSPVTTFPCISAYVGGDIVSGLLSVDHGTFDTPALFLDIGTNGEIALILNDKIVASSTAAGPCFEGMTISSGMRAGEGAIEHVSLKEKLSLEVIGNSMPRGICGSGLMDLVSELINAGIVKNTGRLQARENSEIPEKYKEYLFEKNGKRHFRLTDNISISQEDIRQVQLAKAAIRAGIEALLNENNIAAEEIKDVIIAGGFGYHLKKESLFGVGILPKSINAQVSFIGNSSLGGAVSTLLNKILIDEAACIAKTSHAIDLSQIPAFESKYIREMHF